MHAAKSGTDRKLQWGNRKLLRRLKLRGGVVDEQRHHLPSPQLPYRKEEDRWSGSGSEKEKAAIKQEEKSSITITNNNGNNRERREKKERLNEEDGWGRNRRLMLSLSSKEKEEDFMKMKGCKPSLRPTKRAKSIQRSILLLSPGAWLWDVCPERYQVTEKKTWKKKPSGLKAMHISMKMDSD